MQNAKETASNIAASAKAGMDKTKAVVQEKVERMTAHDPVEKEMATERKEEKISQAEATKQQMRDHNVAATGGTHGHSATGTQSTGMPGAGGTYSHAATGQHGQSTGLHQMSAVPGHGTGHTLGGHVVEGTVASHPIGKATGTGGTAAHNTYAGVNPGANPTGYGPGTGGTYS